MRPFSPFFVIFFVALAQAEAGAMYDFGTMQQGSSFTAEPGKNVTANLYFYMDEEYGNRVAHVTLDPSTVPDGWEVIIDPPLHNTTMNVSGIITTLTENVYVEPKPVLGTLPEVQEPGTHYLQSPSGRGYLQAKRVEVIIKIPAGAELGKTYDVAINGRAVYLGQSGTVALSQSRDFSYKITLASQEYTETIVTNTPLPTATPTPTATATPEPAATQAPPATPPASNEGNSNLLFLAIGFVLVLIILAGVVFVLKGNAAGTPKGKVVRTPRKRV